MRVNRPYLALIAVLILALGALAAPAQERVDLVVLLDSSQSMFPYYGQVMDFVISGALKEYMRFGDGFHILTFAETTQTELAQTLRTDSDVKSALARLHLLYPFGRYTDLVAALKSVYQYVADLPELGDKHIILITDGMHAPSGSSPYAAFTTEDVKSALEATVADVKARGWTMSIVRVPFQVGSGGEDGTEGQSDAPGAGDYLDDVAAALGVGVTEFDPENGTLALDGSVRMVRATYPESLGTVDRAFTLPIGLENPAEDEAKLELVAVLLADGTNVLKHKEITRVAPKGSATLRASILLPQETPEGEQDLVLEPVFADGTRLYPAKAEIQVDIRPSPLAAFFRTTAKPIAFVLILILAMAAIAMAIRYVRSVHRRAEAPVVDAILDSQSSYGSRVSALADARRPDARDASALLAKAGSTGSSRPDAAALLGSRGSAERDRAALLADAAAGGRKDAAGLLGAAAAAAPKAGTLTGPDAGTARGQELLAQAARPDGRDAASLLSSWRSGETGADRRAAVLPASPIGMAPSLSRRGPYEYTPRVVQQGAHRFELMVDGQRTDIGTRNIKTLHAGGRKTLGGKSSDFLVFLLPMPARIADVHYDGQNVTVVPTRPEFFPDYSGPIEDCLDQTIRIVTAKGKELAFRISRYVPPLAKLNKILHCIEMPGPPLPTIVDED